MRLTVGRLITVLIVIAAAAAIAWSVMPRQIPVETAAVTKGRFVATVDEDGKTRVRERYVVAAPLTGRLTRIRLKVGDQVGTDEVVATIAPSPAPFLDPRSRREAEERLGAAEATIERTKASVERARAEADQASNDLARTRTLVERGAATIQAQERAELAMRVADRDLRAAEFLNHAAEHELAQAKALLAQYGDNAKAPPETWNVTAPVPGFVLKVDQESETIVQAGTPIMEIGDPLDLEIVVDVLSTDAVAIHPGAEVIIDNWGGQGTLRGVCAGSSQPLLRRFPPSASRSNGSTSSSTSPHLQRSGAVWAMRIKSIRASPSSPKRMPPSCLPAHCFGRATSGTYLPWLTAALKLGPLHCYGAPAGWPPFRPGLRCWRPRQLGSLHCSERSYRFRRTGHVSR